MSMRHSLLIMISVCVANLAAAGPAEPGRESDDLNEQLRVVYGLVQNSVVRVVNQRTEGPSQGTGVLVAEREEDGQTFGYFVTCAHVISGATRALKLYRMPIDEESGTQTVAAEGSSVKFLANSDYDLAVLRVELAKPGIMRPVSIAEDRPHQRTEAYGLGFGIFAPAHLHIVAMRIGASVTAADYLTEGAKDRDWKVLQAHRERFAGGMSGGPLLSWKEGVPELIGLMFATDLNGAELSVPVEHARAPISDAQRQGNELPDLTPQLAQSIQVLFREDLVRRAQRLGIEDRVEWSGLNSWVEAFESHQGFRERFQEVVIHDQVIDVAPLTRSINADAIGPEERVEVWINRFRSSFSLDENGAAGTWEVPLQDHLTQGDNLLAIRKVAPRGSDSKFDVNDLIRTNRLQFSLRAGIDGNAPYTVIRSLPRIVDRYAVYVTLRRKPASLSTVLEPEENLRLSIRIDALERFLSTSPFLVESDEAFRGEGGEVVARAKGNLFFGAGGNEPGWSDNQFVRLEVLSGETADVGLRGWVANLSSDVAGIQLGFEDPKQRLPFEIRTRVHLVRGVDEKLHITARAIGASSNRTFSVPLLQGDGFSIRADLAGLFTELALQWLNNRYLKPEDPRVISGERLETLTAEIGGPRSDINELVSLRRAFVKEVKGAKWLILTASLQGHPADQPGLALLPTDAPEGAILELVGRGLPIAAAAPFARNEEAADAETPLSTGVLREFTFALTPEADWWIGSEPVDPTQLDRSRAIAPGIGLAETWRKLIQSGSTTLVLDVAGVDRVGNAIRQAINEAIGIPINVGVDYLRIDSVANKLSVGLTLSKRVVNTFPPINEVVKLPIREEFPLRDVVQNKRIEWTVKIGPVRFEIAKFELPVEEIKRIVDLDSLFRSKPDDQASKNDEGSGTHGE